MELKIEKALKLTYEEYVEYLLKKYGTIKDFLKTKQKTNKVLNGNYFLTNSFENKNSNIVRENEGLYIHHIDENKAIMLSKEKYAKNNPYEFQFPERLVYCDLMEHLILHLKIVENPKPLKIIEQVGIDEFVNSIAPSLLDFFAGYTPKENHYLNKVKERIINKKDEFLFVLKYIKDNNVFEKYEKFYHENEIFIRQSELRIPPSTAQRIEVFNLDMNSSIVKEIEKLGWKVSDYSKAKQKAYEILEEARKTFNAIQQAMKKSK